MSKPATDGMVCVVRGLPDAKLAVTLLEGSKSYTLSTPEDKRRHSDTSPSRPAPYQKVDAHTTYYKNAKQQDVAHCDSSTQDNKFASSYQVAHCKVNPTVPNLEVSEFPPQKNSPSRKDGNFEIGGFISRESSPSSKYRNHNEVITNASRQSRETDIFVKSLRKYPNTCSPERSTELIDKLIHYTQLKHGKYESHGLNSTMDHLQVKRKTSPKLVKPKETFAEVIQDLKSFSLNNTSKGVQTYTRNINATTKTCKDIPHRLDRAVSGSFKETKVDNKINKSTEKIGSVISNKQSMDVRYICDMTKNIRERIKQIIEEGVDGIIIDNNCGSHSCPQHRMRPDQRKYERHNLGNVSPGSGSVDFGIQATENIYGRQVSACCLRSLRNTRCGSLTKHSICDEEFIRDDDSKAHEDAQIMDEFNTTIKNWVDTLPIDESNCDCVLEKSDIVNKFDRHLRAVAMHRPKCKNLYQQILRDKTICLLRKLPLKPSCCNKDTLIRYALNLVDELSNIILNNQGIGSTGEINKNVIKEEVIDVIENAHVTTDKTQINNTADEIVNVLNNSPEVMRGGDDDGIVNDISNILQHIDKVNSSNADEIAKSIINRVHEVSVTEPSRTPLNETSRRNSFQQSIVISDINKMKDLVKEWLEKEKIKTTDNKAVDDLAMRLAHIEKHKDKSEAKRDAEAKQQINAWLENILDGKRLKLVNQITQHLIDELKAIRVGSPSGSPLRRSNANGRENQLKSSSNINQTTNGENKKARTSADVKIQDLVFLQDLETEINKWLEDQQYNNIKSTQIKNEMLKQLATEIFDRQKYIKSNPNKTFFEVEEDEYLEYQVLKWLNKIAKTPFDNENNFPPDISDLINLIKKLKKRDLVENNLHNKTNISKKSRSQNITHADTSLGDQTDDAYDIFTHEIAAWCNDLPIPTGTTEVEAQRREAMLLELMLNVFTKINDIAGNDQIFENNSLLKQILFEYIIQLLDELPQNPELDRLKIPMTEQLVDKIIANKDCFRKSTDAEYLNILHKWSNQIFSYIEHLIPECHLPGLKLDLLNKIHCKAFECARDPIILSDGQLFQDLMCEEIENIIDTLPKDLELQRNKHVQALFISNEIYKNRQRYLEGQSHSEACICKNKPGPSNEKDSSRKGQSFLKGYESFKKEVPISSSLIQTQGQRDRQNMRNLSHIPEQSTPEHSRQSGYSQTTFRGRNKTPNEYETFKNEIPVSSSPIQPQSLDRQSKRERLVPEQVLLRNRSMEGAGISNFGEKQTGPSNVSPSPVTRKQETIYQKEQSSDRFYSSNATGMRSGQDEISKRYGKSNTNNMNWSNYADSQADEENYTTLSSTNSPMVSYDQKTPAGTSYEPVRALENNNLPMCPTCQTCHENHNGGSRKDNITGSPYGSRSTDQKHHSDVRHRRDAVSSGTNIFNRSVNHDNYQEVPKLSVDEAESLVHFIEKMGPKLGLDVQPFGTSSAQNSSGGYRNLALDLQPRRTAQNSQLNKSDGYKSGLINNETFRENADQPNRRYSMERFPDESGVPLEQSRMGQSRLPRQLSFDTTNSVRRSREKNPELKSRPICDCTTNSRQNDVCARSSCRTLTNITPCPNCCGTRCPFPSYLYFR